MNDLAQEIMRNIFAAVASFFSFLIATLLGYFGQKFSEFYKTEIVNRSLLPHSVQTFHLMNLILVSIFILRGILIILSAANFGHFPSDTEVVKTNSSPHSHITHIEMTYFLITEILPCSFVLLTLWQPLCPKSGIVKKSIDDVNLNHSEMHAKYNDMFSPRGSQLSRDGDDVVRVIYSTGVSNVTTTVENPLGCDDLESPSQSVCLSPMSQMNKKQIAHTPKSAVTLRNDLTLSPSQTPDHLPPRMPGPIGRRPVVVSPMILQTSDDTVGEGRPSDANDLQYYHPDLSLDQIQKDFSYSSSTDHTLPSPALPPQHSVSSSIASVHGGLAIVPSSNNWSSWLMGSDAATTPPLHRPPSAPSASSSTSFYNNIANFRTSFGTGGTSPRRQIVIASLDEKEQLSKQYGNVLSPKYILQRSPLPSPSSPSHLYSSSIGSPNLRTNS
jgi:hypothetical protein